MDGLQLHLCMWDGSTRSNVALLMMILQMLLMSFGWVSFGGIAYLFHRFDKFRTQGLDFVKWPVVWLMISMGLAYAVVHFLIFLVGEMWVNGWVCLAITDWKLFFRNQSILQIFTFISVFFIILLIIIIIIAGDILKNYKKELQTNSISAIKDFLTKYVKNDEAKILIDRIQFEYRCCGAETFKEWFDIEWADKKYLSEERHSRTKQSLLPFSCCNIRTRESCQFFSLEIPQSSSSPPIFNSNNSIDFVVTSVNRKGCYQRLTHNILYWMDLLRNMYYGSIIIEIMDIILLRYLQTSTDTALMHGDPQQMTRGYFCYPGNYLTPPGFEPDPEKLAEDQRKLQQEAYDDDDDNDSDDGGY